MEKQKMNKTIFGIVLASIFLLMVGVVSAETDVAPRDGTGVYHDEVIAAGGQNGTGSMDGTGVMAQTMTQLRDGTYNAGEGQQLQIRAKDGTGNRVRLMVGDAEAETELELSSEGQKIKAKLSNGRNAEVKVMPNTASEKALERLRLKNCSGECVIELKQVGQGDQAKLAYEVQAERHARILGLFQTKMQVRAEVDAESGEVLRVGKPWWAFLAAEPAEE